MPTSADPQDLLPTRLRDDWAVVPRVTLNWLFVAGMLIGAGMALTAAGFALGQPALRWAFLAALAAAWLGRAVLAPLERRRLADLRRD